MTKKKQKPNQTPNKNTQNNDTKVSHAEQPITNTKIEQLQEWMIKAIQNR